jgi:methylthioribose-1-phosphate isomerase
VVVPDGARILTHCNAGALATGGYGTALGVVRAAHAMGKKVRVLATETRPYLQGARLTAWELAKDGIPVEVITDNMVGHFMQKREIDLVIVGADRIARSGDVANKIGTYAVAVLAQAHGVPFYVAAPWSTVDLACPNGDSIPIEQRSEREVTHFGDVQLVPDTVNARHPAFDVTPAHLVRAIFTEHGTVSPVDEAHLVNVR